MLMIPRRQLLVVESNGAPRSGKGAITSALAESFTDGAQDETGADYRAVTYGLLKDGKIEADMPEDTLLSSIAKLSSGEVADYAAQRYEIVAESSDSVLYTPVINETVAKISGFVVVRTAVKEGFTRRVIRQVDNPDINILSVDGRNLGPVIEKIEGAELLMRFFVDCQPHVAALREAARQGIDLTKDENNAWFLDTKASIKQRKIKDEQREIDPVQPDSNAIRYWHNDDVMSETVLHLARTRRVPIGVAADMLNNRFRTDGRRGAGAKAVVEGRQVYFDTSEIGKFAMVDLARRMVDEALDQRAGNYHPLSDQLFATS